MSDNMIKTKNPVSPEHLKLLRELNRLIRKSRGVIVAGHVNPDGDDISSQLALGSYLASIGKKYLVLAEEKTPPAYSFLPDVNMIRPLETLEGKPSPDEYDLVIVVDSGDFDRIGKVRGYLPEGATVVNVDHHRGNTRFGHVNIVAEKACSIGEILYYFFKTNSIRITYPVAVQLYISIVTDTGSFRYDCMHGEVHQIASELLELGVVPADFSIYLFQNKKAAYLKLLSTMLSRMEITDNGRIACSVLKADDFKNPEDDDTDGLIEYLGMVDTVSVYVLIKEKDAGLVTASLRSKFDVDVASIASAFGGGGHLRAAGCKTDKMDLPAFKDKLVGLIRERLPKP